MGSGSFPKTKASQPKTLPNIIFNYGRKAVAWLPTLNVSGMVDPVIQIIDETSGEIVYTVRIKGTTFRPKVFTQGVYTMKIGEPGTGQMKTVQGVNAATDNNKTLDVKF